MYLCTILPGLAFPTHHFIILYMFFNGGENTVGKAAIQRSEGKKIQNSQKQWIPPDLCLLARVTIKHPSCNKPSGHGRWTGVENTFILFQSDSPQFTGIQREREPHWPSDGTLEESHWSRKSHSCIYSWLPLVIHARTKNTVHTLHRPDTNTHTCVALVQHSATGPLKETHTHWHTLRWFQTVGETVRQDAAGSSCFSRMIGRWRSQGLWSDWSVADCEAEPQQAWLYVTSSLRDLCNIQIKIDYFYYPQTLCVG